MYINIARRTGALRGRDQQPKSPHSLYVLRNPPAPAPLGRYSARISDRLRHRKRILHRPHCASHRTRHLYVRNSVNLIQMCPRVPRQSHQILRNLRIGFPTEPRNARDGIELLDCAADALHHVYHSRSIKAQVDAHHCFSCCVEVGHENALVRDALFGGLVEVELVCINWCSYDGEKLCEGKDEREEVEVKAEYSEQLKGRGEVR
ncbi:hypothetical protein PENSPDRAFT_650807 [Peniophora sp. CONT]|nr:hypothetical protein PENSPDRAFT_650807 [Peniophora sp. CONT]